MSCVIGGIEMDHLGQRRIPSSRAWASPQACKAQRERTTHNLIDGHESLYHGNLGLDEYSPSWPRGP